MNIVITESAADDLADGYIFYEKQFPGLGSYFETSIFADLRSLVLYAGIHEIHFKHYFRKIASRFPYSIYYTLDDETIRIHAIADNRRDPRSITDKLAAS